MFRLRFLVLAFNQEEFGGGGVRERWHGIHYQKRRRASDEEFPFFQF